MLPATVVEYSQKGGANSLARSLERNDDFDQRLLIARDERQIDALRCKLMET
jgi:hypothetical protein